MTRIAAILVLITSIAARGDPPELSFADRIVCEVQKADGTSLRGVTWRQGTSPLVDLYVTRRGLPVAYDAGVTGRLVYALSATNPPIATVTNYASTNNSFLCQVPTLATNSAGAAWWYSVYFDYRGRTYWAGSGDLVIQPAAGE